MAEALTLLEYDAVSTCNRTVSQVRKGDIVKGENRRKQEEEVWEDRETCHMKWKCMGVGGVRVGVREADRIKAMFRTGK